MRVVTAKKDQVLRDFAESVKGNNHIAIFPERGLSPDEQAAFLKNNTGNYKAVITFSPYIVSDADDSHVLDVNGHTEIDMGCSINKVNLSLWRRETIGDIAQDKLDELRKLRDVTPKELLQGIIDEAYKLGDSVERVLFVHSVLNRMDEN